MPLYGRRRAGRSGIRRNYSLIADLAFYVDGLEKLSDRLHEFAQHTIHSSETLDIVIDTMAGILGQHERFLDAGRSYIAADSIVSRRTRQHLRFQIQMMRSLRARSKANQARLRNKIDLVSWRGDLAGPY